MMSPSPARRPTTTSDDRWTRPSGARPERLDASDEAEPPSPDTEGGTASGVPIDTGDLGALGELLSGLDGVEQVLRGADGGFWLRVDPQVTPGRILGRARSLVAETGFDPEAVPVHLVVDATTRERRVRFDNVERVDNADRSVTVSVTLEWEESLHTVSVTGEKGDQIELRTAAHAAMAAVEKVIEQPLHLRLVGVKHMRAFDGELIVVSIVGGEGEGRRTMLGAVLAGSDSFRGTALAVLMALNRLLGNYLVTR